MKAEGTSDTRAETISRVRDFIAREQLFPPGIPLLVACSGGADSVAALQVLRELGHPVALAHCNFALRDGDADLDQEFVKELAGQLDIPFYSKVFDTSGYAREHNCSIQEAARDLRYRWLEQTRREQGFHFVVTGHHRDDNAETVLFNLARGSGLAGLHGIPPKRGQVTRPLLCLTRKDILLYLQETGAGFREDASNLSVKYSRNFIRHKVMPLLEEINPGVITAVDGLTQRVREAEALIEERLRQIRRKIVAERYGAVEVKFRYLRQHPAGRSILFSILRDYGFGREQSEAVYNDLGNRPGTEFLSATHRVLKDRNSLYILEKEVERTYIQRYEQLPASIRFNNYTIRASEVPAGKVKIRPSSDLAFLDMDKVTLPITIRYWRAGDHFYPMGLTRPRTDKPAKKKLSKYFKDEHFSTYSKETTAVMFSGDRLMWVVGHRIDERFKVTEDTRTVWRLKVHVS